MYGEDEWTRTGATLSDKAAMKDYGLSRDELYGAMRAGKLQYREQCTYGNPWFRLLRREVEEFVADQRGKTSLDNQKHATELAQIERRLRSLKRETKKLEQRRVTLQTMLKQK